MPFKVKFLLPYQFNHFSFITRENLVYVEPEEVTTYSDY